MARRPELEEFARKHNLKIGTIADLIRYRLRNERSVERVSEQSVQTEYGEFRLYAYEDRVQKGVHLALTHGVLDGKTAPLVRVHVADTLRDLLGVRGDPNAWTLRAAMERIAHAGSGVVVILRDQETAAELTEALRALGAADAKAEGTTAARPAAPPARPAAHTTPAVGAGGQVLRTYGVGAQILKDLGVKRMRVLSAPKQMHGISAFGLEIEGYVGEGT
jgi:3,4-dihydroxy 2-butanone 4-phosphate synthase/GTP cyclohydrolase II